MGLKLFENRLQCVSIDGSLSKFQLVQHGVPQGSILGPLLYIIFTNELPEVTHGDCVDVAVTNEQTWPNYTMFCSSCGSVGCYADDTTYTCSGSDATALFNNLTSKFKTVSDFLLSNKLKLNDDKTHLMVMSTSQSRLSRAKKDTTYNVEIRTPAKIIESSQSEKLLGCIIHQDMKWSEHI